MYLEPTGDYNYFTTTNYREKHWAVRVNPKTGEVLQNLNSDIVPKFITGTDKAEIIKNDLMYSRMFNRFEECIAEVDKILISGYSFGDEHINEELKKRNNFHVVNQNPGSKYPFEASKVIQIESLKQL